MAEATRVVWRFRAASTRCEGTIVAMWRRTEVVFMKVKEIMTPEPKVCSPSTNLAAAAALMLDGDCGILPVVDRGELVGVVTDRDMYIALATRNKPASDVTIREVATKQVLTCGPDDDVQTALAAMKEHRIRRLPVEGFGGTIQGIISINDIVLRAGPRKPFRSDAVVEVFQAICAHHHPMPHVAAV